MITEERIAAYINPDAGPGEARIRGRGVPIWALIGHLPAVQGNLDRLAAEYGLPLEAVEAALAYYHRHQKAIDARLLLNSD